MIDRRMAASVVSARVRFSWWVLFSIPLLLLSNRVFAHASEQAFVLLLPTGVYMTAGVLTVVLTIILVAYLPSRFVQHDVLRNRLSVALLTIKNRHEHSDTPDFSASDIVSLASTILLIALLWIGFSGSHDPLENPLPLFIWTLWWIGFVVIQGLVGDLWQWVNPWTGLYRLMKSRLAALGRFNLVRFSLPAAIGVWPAVLGLILFMLFALADIAPDAPDRLAWIVSLYWLLTLAGLCVFGEQWLSRAECFTILLRRYAQLGFVGRRDSTIHFGFPGWQALAKPARNISAAVFILVLLGTGSFDGFNETFYWLGLIGVNPLEFPGRSAVVTPTVVGLLLANLLLVAVYASCIFAGTVIANRGAVEAVSFRTAFCKLAIAILPIAFAYHFAHFLTAFLVNAQYALAAASDPLDNGADILGLGTFYVTTGFMNSHHTVEAIWLTQAAAVVFGHVLSVLLAHALALDLFGSARRAIMSQAPLAAFMVLYTFIGLWLLAAPRGA